MDDSLTLRLQDPVLAVARLPVGNGLPWWAAATDGFLVYCRDTVETTVVCDDRRVPGSVPAERGFRALRIDGPLPFDATGVLSAVAGPLAGAGIPIFAISTFETDYILIRQEDLASAMGALAAAGHTVRGDPQGPATGAIPTAPASRG